MRLRAWAVCALLISSGMAFAQEPPKPEQLKRMYDEAVAQLKAAQDRKTELAQQNEQLTAKVAELNKELEAARAEMVTLKRRDAESAERSFFLRSQYAAWQEFLERFPETKIRWNDYLGTDLLNPRTSGTAIYDPEWPLATSNEG